MAAQPNGSADAPIEVSALPTVVGINFGNSYASIAVLTKEGSADCIANEDGERQIACAVSFHGEEMYIGNQAKHQLIKNSQNTITGFRNLLGKKFSELSFDKPSVSALVIQHPEQTDIPAYKVQVLQAAPSPLPTTASNTPAASHTATPRSEPTPAERILSVSEVTSIFLKSLIQSAEDFLGKKVQGAVISVPDWFTDAQRAALQKAAEDAEINVLQLLEEAGAAAAVTTTSTTLSKDLNPDRTQLVVDLGASALELSLLSIRQGLAYSLATLSDTTVSGDAIDDKLIKHFAKEFTKKTKTPLAVVPAPTPQDKRAEAKLRLAVEHTKRTLSASPGTATCSVESLKDGLDFTGTITRLRFDMEMRSVYAQVFARVRELVGTAGLDLYDIDEIVYVGGSASLPGLDEALAQGLSETVVTPFTEGAVVGGGVGDPTAILSRGCALQARLVAMLAEGTEEEREVRAAFASGSEWTRVRATTRTVGMLFPEEGAEGEGAIGGQWVPAVLRETAVPCRRTFRLDVDVGAEQRVGFELWEAKEGVKIEKVKPPRDEEDEPVPAEEGEEEEEEEEIEVKEKTVEKETLLGALAFAVKTARRTGDRWTTKIEVQFLMDDSGGLEVSAWEVGPGGKGERSVVVVPAP
ncbi:actin-like ATPase domain-containing protein [Laetiporus sulphureus 93-53]|uniref:Actin-like ATPase domain-containing protein n=1 Tax=Laetiporus sulphureus 93-53 TaxID=1314785 RepID=A0A165BEU7_9APHY|nr:actin-like ATPase domain-containing protein [Laetiporus sulphureus 93-53]KZT00901.1 actin-like ATPase domain-containing protein [Laetiporus sulphureus 93-53]